MDKSNANFKRWCATREEVLITCMAMHTLTFQCVENISATGTHSCREGEGCALVTLALGSHGKNVMVTLSCLGQFCVIALKHNFRAVVAPQTVSCTTGGAQGAPKKPFLRRTSMGTIPALLLLLIIHLPHLSPRHLSRVWIIVTNESNPDLCAQVRSPLLTQDNSPEWELED